MKTEQEIFEFVESTKQLAVLGKDNWDSLFDAAFEKEYPGLKADAISYQGEHIEDEVFECNDVLVAWINWQTGNFYIIPGGYKKPSLDCSIEENFNFCTIDSYVDANLAQLNEMQNNKWCLQAYYADMVKQCELYQELKANPSKRLIVIARNVLMEIGNGQTRFSRNDLHCSIGELWYISHLIEDVLKARYLRMYFEDNLVLEIHPITFYVKDTKRIQPYSTIAG